MQRMNEWMRIMNEWRVWIILFRPSYPLCTLTYMNMFGLSWARLKGIKCDISRLIPFLLVSWHDMAWRWGRAFVIKRKRDSFSMFRDQSRRAPKRLNFNDNSKEVLKYQLDSNFTFRKIIFLILNPISCCLAIYGMSTKYLNTFLQVNSKWVLTLSTPKDCCL